MLKMKRVSEEGAEDPLYEYIKTQTAEKRRMLRETLAKKCQPAPLQGIDGFFAALAKPVAEDLGGGNGQIYMITLFEEIDDFDDRERPIRGMLDCEWWDSVVDWFNNDVASASAIIAKHGGEKDIAAFWDSQCDEFAALRAAILDGWNVLHPRLPASWNEDRNTLVIKFVE